MGRRLATPTERRRSGLITGHVLKLARESAGITQERLAEHLGVDWHTVQAWETGRRSLTSTHVAGLTRLRNGLRHLGALPHLVAMLAPAIEVDLLLGDILADNQSPEATAHPLAQWVMSKPATELLLWPVTGMTPAAFNGHTPATRHGPVATRPVLNIAERAAFFDRLQTVAERSLHHNDEQSLLLRRQVYYLSAHDQRPGTPWLRDAERVEERSLRADSVWSPDWVVRRSLLVAKARRGDREPLQRFVARAMRGQDELEAANLNYWAYWAGEATTSEHADAFMAGVDLGGWDGQTLLRRLVEDLRTDNACADLAAHAVWALLARRGYLLGQNQTLTSRLRQRVEALLDDIGLVPDTRRELESVVYAIRVTDTTVR